MYTLVDLSKPGQRYTHGWVPVAGGAHALTKAERAEVHHEAMVQRYGPTHPMALRAKAKYELAAAHERGQYNLTHPHAEVKRKRAKMMRNTLLSFLELSPAS